MKKRDLTFILILLFVLAAFRCVIFLPTLNKYCLWYYRLGTQPIADALAWVNLSRDMLHGMTIEGKPLLTLTLVNLFTLFHNHFLWYGIFLSCLGILSFLVSFYLLKDIRNNIFIVVFLAFLSMWDAPIQLSISTEALVIPFIIITFTLLVRSMYYRSYNCFFIAMVTLGVVQTIRPGDIFSLFILPLFPIASFGFLKKNIRFTFLALIGVVTGMSFFLLASVLYCHTGGIQGELLIRLWAQAHRATGIYQVWTINKDAAVTFVSGHWGNTTNNALWKDTTHTLLTHPEYLIETISCTIIGFFTLLPSALHVERFGNMSYLLAVGIILFTYFFDKEKIRIMTTALRKKHFLLAIITSTVLFYAVPSVFLTTLAVIGTGYILFRGERAYKVLFILYSIAIFCSVLVVGIGGGYEWISADVFLYCLVAFGICAVFNGFRKETRIAQEFVFDAKSFFSAFLFISLALFLFFIVAPTIVRATAVHTKKSAPLAINEAEIKQHFNVTTPLLSSTALRYLMIRWPEPSFEQVPGFFCYVPVSYKSYHAVYFKAGEGTGEEDNDYWPLHSFPFARTVYIDVDQKIIIPGQNRETLSRFDNKEIVVFGRLIVIKRAIMRATGYAIVASNIGYINDSGQLEWITLEKVW